MNLGDGILTGVEVTSGITVIVFAIVSFILLALFEESTRYEDGMRGKMADYTVAAGLTISFAAILAAIFLLGHEAQWFGGNPIVWGFWLAVGVILFGVLAFVHAPSLEDEFGGGPPPNE